MEAGQCFHAFFFLQRMNIMRIVCFLFTVFLSLPTHGQNTADDIEILTFLKEVEWPKAYRNQDTVLLDRILADEFQMIDASGNWSTKRNELDYIKANKPSYDSFRFEIKRLDIFENNTAIVAGIGHIIGKDDQGQYKMTYHSSNVLIKRKSAWKAISSHVSGIHRE